MTRRYRDPVEVRTAEGAGDPSAFVWHGRLYVVRALLDHWHERRDWWQDVAEPDAAEPAGPTVWGELEQDVWRVEASAGRRQGSGVYDLVRHGGRPRDHQWRLVRVAD